MSRDTWCLTWAGARDAFGGRGLGTVQQGRGRQSWSYPFLAMGLWGTPLRLLFHICKMGFRAVPIFWDRRDSAPNDRVGPRVLAALPSWWSPLCTPGRGQAAATGACRLRPFARRLLPSVPPFPRAPSSLPDACPDPPGLLTLPPQRRCHLLMYLLLCALFKNRRGSSRHIVGVQ